MPPSSDVPLRKVYVRYREDMPETEMQSHAVLGFRTLGVETVPFYWVDDIAGFGDLGPEVGVAGYIGDIYEGCRVMGVAIPPNVDYPEALRSFLGRRVWEGTLGEVRGLVEPVFVKPKEHKAFTGFVWRGVMDAASRMRVVTHGDDVEVYLAEPVTFVAEYRAFVYYNRVILPEVQGGLVGGSFPGGGRGRAEGDGEGGASCLLVGLGGDG